MIINFGVQSELLDQTILQAITLTECYLALNPSVSCTVLKEVAIVAMVLGIKNNEDVVLKLDECLNVRESFIAQQPASWDHPDNATNPYLESGIFDVKMFAELERAMFSTLEYRIN